MEIHEAMETLSQRHQLNHEKLRGLAAMVVLCAASCVRSDPQSIIGGDGGGILVQPPEAITDNDDRSQEAESARALVGLLDIFQYHFDALNAGIEAALEDSANLEVILNTTPTSIIEAMQHARGCVEEMGIAGENFVAAQQAWAKLDVLTGRMRVQCVKDLLASGGLTATAADKQASDHPAYTQHKDATAAAQATLVDAEHYLAYATRRADLAIAFVNAFAKAGATTSDTPIQVESPKFDANEIVGPGARISKLDAAKHFVDAAGAMQGIAERVSERSTSTL